MNLTLFKKSADAFQPPSSFAAVVDETESDYKPFSGLHGSSDNSIQPRFKLVQSDGHDVYILGSLQNPVVAQLANDLRNMGVVVFDDWQASPPNADEFWREYSEKRGQNLFTALRSEAARNVFEFDKRHMDKSKMAIMVAPFGTSVSTEAGYMVGCGKPVICYMTQEQQKLRWDVMLQFHYLIDNYEAVIEQTINALGEGIGGKVVRLSPVEDVVDFNDDRNWGLESIGKLKREGYGSTSLYHF